MNTRRRRFVVIGAGASGLAALRVLADELKDELASGDCEIICFEKRKESGGIWLPEQPAPPLADIPETPLYDALITNLPIPVMCYPSFEPTHSTGLFPPHQDVLEYLHKYKTQFNLQKFINFNTVVDRAFWDRQRNQWEVSALCGGKLEPQIMGYFDHLFIGNGHYSKPYSPALPGLDLWAAHESRHVTHSMWYREPSPYKDLRVLVIGGGPSGNDISTDVSTVAAETIQSVRSLDDGQSGQIILCGSIDHFTAEGLVVFANGEQAYVDRVILATGYQYDFPFLPQLPSRPPKPHSTTLYNSGSHIYPLAQHVFPLLAPFPPTSAAFLGLPSKVAPLPLIEVQALLSVRVMMGRVEVDFDHELRLAIARSQNLLETYDHSAELAAKAWHVLGVSDIYYSHLENLWRLAGEPNRVVPEWTHECYDKRAVLRDGWRDLVKKGQANSWVQGVGEGGIDEWVKLMYRLLRWVESGGRQVEVLS